MPVIHHDTPTRAKAPVPPHAVMSLDDFRKAAREGTVPRDAIVRSPAESVVEPAGRRRLRFTLSTPSVDRDRDVLNPSGWLLDNYKRSPVVMWAHDYKTPPIGRATSVEVKDGKLVAEAEFTPPDLNPFGDMIYRMLKAGFLGGASVGFGPKEYQYNAARGGTDFHKQELLEFSIVPIPSNPDAIIQARAAGIDTAPLKAWASRVLTDDRDAVVRFDDRDLVRAFEAFAREHLGPMIRAALRDQRRRFGVIDDELDEPVLRPRDDGDGDGDEVFNVDPDAVRAAIREYAAGEIRKALKKLRGEV